MAKYQRADESIADLAAKIVARDYLEIHELMTLDHENARALTIDFVMVHGDEDDQGEPLGPAILHQGYPAAGLCKVVGLLNRALGQADVQIQLDAGVWKNMARHEREALLAHEIHHIIPKADKYGAIQRDDLGRVKVELRKHDYQLGVFTEIAKRYGDASGEVRSFRAIFQENGESFFPFLQLPDAPH